MLGHLTPRGLWVRRSDDRTGWQVVDRQFRVLATFADYVDADAMVAADHALELATLEAVDVDEHGQLSLGVPGEQMPLMGLAPPAPTTNQKEG